MHTVNQKKQRKYIDYYNTEEKNESCARCKQKTKTKKKKQKKKTKKVHRFNHLILTYIQSSYVHAVNKNTKIQSTNHLNSSSHLILIRHYSYVHRFLFSNEYSLLSFHSSVCNKRQGKCPLPFYFSSFAEELELLLLTI